MPIDAEDVDLDLGETKLCRTKKKWRGPLQYEDPTGELMMLPTDMVCSLACVTSSSMMIYHCFCVVRAAMLMALGISLHHPSWHSFHCAI